MSETPMVTFSSVDNPITWNIEGESKCLVFASPSEAKRAEELFTAMQRALTAEREIRRMRSGIGICAYIHLSHQKPSRLAINDFGVLPN